MGDIVQIDLRDGQYPKRIILYIFAGALDAAWQTYAYWMMGSMSNDPSKLAFYAGFYKGLQSAGAAIIWAIDGKIGSEKALATSWGLMAGGLLLAIPMVWLRIKSRTSLDDETMVRNVDNVEEQINERGTTDEEYIISNNQEKAIKEV